MGSPPTLALLQAASSLSPCSPMIKAWTLRLSTPRCSPSSYLKRPVSSLMTGQYGLDDVVLSIPAVVDANGIETVVPIELSESELRELKKSAEVLKGIIKENV